MRLSAVVSTAFAPAVICWSIGGLFGHRRPAAVVRLVVAGTVATVKRHALRALPHIREKIEKATTAARFPSVTDGYAPATVSGVRSVAWVTAAPEHRHPTLVSGSARHAVWDDAGDVLLECSGGADLGLSFLGLTKHASSGVVSRDVLTDHSTAREGQLSASALARLGLDGLPFVVAFDKPFEVLIPEIWTPDDALATTAGAQRRFQAMASQEVRSLVAEQVLGGDFLSASALANHRPILTRVWERRSL